MGIDTVVQVNESPDLWVWILGPLVGALLGGLISLGIAIMVTTRTLSGQAANQRQSEAARIERERRAAAQKAFYVPQRQRVNVDAAIEMLVETDAREIVVAFAETAYKWPDWDVPDSLTHADVVAALDPDDAYPMQMYSNGLHLLLGHFDKLRSSAATIETSEIERRRDDVLERAYELADRVNKVSAILIPLTGRPELQFPSPRERRDAPALTA